MLVHTGKYKTPLLQNIRNVAATTILIIKISATLTCYISLWQAKDQQCLPPHGQTVKYRLWVHSWLVATGSGIRGFQTKICSVQMNRICSLPQQY